jgi:hypothetical protein
MKNQLLRFVSALGLALGAMRSSKSQQTPVRVQIGTPDLDALTSGTPARRGVWHSPFNRREHRQGKRFRSQRSRSNRRKASR